MTMSPATEISDAPIQVEHPRLQRFYAYWIERKGVRRFPARRDIDPIDFPYMLGNLMLLDVLRDPICFHVRLHGSNMAARAGYDLTGKPLDALPIADYRSYVIQRCEGLIASGRPLAVRHDRVLGTMAQRYEALWLPFSDDGHQVTMLACALVYNDVRRG